MLLTKEVEINLHGNNIKYYKEKGYKTDTYKIKHGTKLLVSVEDLSKGSRVEVEYLCDYCLETNKNTIIKIPYKEYLRNRKSLDKDCCVQCKSLKCKELLQIKYGDNHFNKYTQDDYKSIHKYDSLFESKNLIPITETFLYIDDKIICKCKIHNLVIDNLSIRQIKAKIYPCKECLHEFKKQNQRKDFDEVKEEFLRNGLVVCNDAYYENSHTKIKCYCIKHPQEIQYINSQQAVRQYHGCKFCKEMIKIGKNNPNWKGGIRSIHGQIRASEEYIEWRNKVYERDNYACQCCGDATGGNLAAHHIKNFSNNEDLRFDVDNGITLCDLCHNPNKYGSFHHQYGVCNNNREQLIEYISRFQNREFEELRNRNII